MIHLDKAVIVEGKYDKIRLSSFIDAEIITTDGFGIFKNREKAELIRKAANKRGIIIMTDSDGAGFLIRSHLSGIVPPNKITNVFIP
ncbi:MAG: toprim domain-containing protein, partial [Acutalibacteraceae bacterium]